ncbi:MAG: hypothetical protein MJZ74_07460 [Muribaculaceae bacterium]|nr:hypothetical protein [Muribaculaceae bacterium]
MKAIFIAFDQAYYERLVDDLHNMGCRGFTAWQEVMGRGTKTGEPHYGSHAWPSIAGAMFVMCPASKVEGILAHLHELDMATPKLGLRAWVMPVEQSI